MNSNIICHLYKEENKESVTRVCQTKIWRKASTLYDIRIKYDPLKRGQAIRLIQYSSASDLDKVR